MDREEKETGALSDAMSYSSSSSALVPSRYPSVSETKTGSTGEGMSRTHRAWSDGDKEPLIAPRKKIPGFVHVRHQLGIYIFFGMTFVCSMRQAVSVAMVAMVNDSYVSPDHGTGGNRSAGGGVEQCDLSHSNSSSKEGAIDGEYNWSAHTQELLLAAFFYGYIFTQILGGWLSDRFGMKWVIGFGLLLSSVSTLLSPPSVTDGGEWYFFLRFCCGLGEGVAFPSMLSLWSKWAHPRERSRLSVIGYAGYNMGLLLGNVLPGYTIDSDIGGGWPFPFYLFGGLGCLWFVFWSFLAYSSPREHPWISQEEREYIEEGLGLPSNDSARQGLVVPWVPMILSPAIWTLSVTHFCHTCAMFTLMVNLPLYYSDGLGLPLQQVGLLSAIPFVVNMWSMVVFGQISDRLISRGLLSKHWTRKVMAATGFGGGGLCLLVAGWARCSVTGVVVSISVAMMAVGPVFSGHFVSLLDVSGPFAGSAMGIMNTAGTVGGIVGPYFVGVFTEVQSDISGWQKVMWLLGGFYLFAGLVYVSLGTVEFQPWARIRDTIEKTTTKYGTTEVKTASRDQINGRAISD